MQNTFHVVKVDQVLRKENAAAAANAAAHSLVASRHGDLNFASFSISVEKAFEKQSFDRKDCETLCSKKVSRDNAFIKSWEIKVGKKVKILGKVDFLGTFWTVCKVGQP